MIFTKYYGGGKAPVYCPDCGALLKVRMVVSRYNGDTGKPIYHYHVKCAKRPWWHRSYEYDETGTEVLHYSAY